MHHPGDPARFRASMPPGTQTILNARSLANDHGRLATLLQPGQTVLDAGCGTGAITRGIADAVAPHGHVLGADIHPGLIHEAQHAHHGISGCAFIVCDLYDLPFRAAFEITSAARVLQWLAHPLEALREVTTVTKPGGKVVVLDFNHEKVVWQPDPPKSMQFFYAAFLQWRTDAGMNNALADHLASMFAAVGLEDIVVTPQHEVSYRHDPDFATRIGVWAEVAATRGHQMVRDGMLTETQRLAAETDYRVWMRHEAISQSLYLLAVDGTRQAA